MSRKPRKSPSHQRLEAEGWDDREPTDVIDLALERVKRTTEESREKLRLSREELSQASKEFEVDVEETVRAVHGTSLLPPKEAASP